MSIHVVLPPFQSRSSVFPFFLVGKNEGILLVYFCGSRKENKRKRSLGPIGNIVDPFISIYILYTLVDCYKARAGTLLAIKLCAESSSISSKTCSSSYKLPPLSYSTFEPALVSKNIGKYFFFLGPGRAAPYNNRYIVCGVGSSSSSHFESPVFIRRTRVSTRRWRWMMLVH